MTRQQPIKILIVGAGIGGLTAASALRKHGHQVEVFESSGFLSEVGAAVHVGPNATAVLSQIGIDLKPARPNRMSGTSFFDGVSGERVAHFDYTQLSKKWSSPWWLCHRASLHKLLREYAFDPNGEGPVPVLHLKSAVASVDPFEGSLTTLDGRKVYGDVIVGADGVHSKTRNALRHGPGYKPFDSGNSGYRFLLPIATIKEHQSLNQLVDREGGMSIFVNGPNRLICYPCDENTVLNAMMMFPSEVTEPRVDDQWNRPGKKSDMIKLAQGMPKVVLDLLELVSEDNLKLWTILDMATMPDWTLQKLALIGDAAHPFTPHHGQGAAQAMEDAACLSVMLSGDLSRDDIPERLQLYASTRMPRAHKIQQISRDNGLPPHMRIKLGMPPRPKSIDDFNHGHDEFHRSQDVLRRHLHSKHPYRWRAPVCSAFGPAVGPQQPFSGLLIPGQKPKGSQTIRTIDFKTSRTYLESLLPKQQYSFEGLATIVGASIKCHTFKDVEWLGGASHSYCGLYVEGIKYNKSDGQAVHGTFLPVLFEDSVDSLQSNSTDLGLPSVFCDISIEESSGETKLYLGQGKTKFATFSWKNLKKYEPQLDGISESEARPNPAMGMYPSLTAPIPKSEGFLVHRYLPGLGSTKPDLEYAALVSEVGAGSGVTPNTNGTKGVNGTNGHSPLPEDYVHVEGPKPQKLEGEGSMEFSAGSWETLPRLHNIAKFMTAMPVYSIERASVEELPHAGVFGSAVRIE